jgi:predicted lipid-binding transport protein (Tim44 family)
LLLVLFGLLLGGQLMKGRAASSIPMIFVGLAALVYQLSQLNQTEAVHVEAAAPRRNPHLLSQHMVGLKRRDEGFSRVVFLDFVQAVYHGVYGWMGTPQHKHLQAYVADEVMNAVAREAGGAHVRNTQVVLGMMYLEQIQLPADKDVILVELEGNYTRERPSPGGPGGKDAVRLVVRERWRFERPKGTASPAPERMRALCCVACGAALSVSELGACTYCGAALRDGKLAWRLTRRTVLSSEAFSTDGLGETVEEQGTDDDTVEDDRLEKDGPPFAAAHGFADLDAFAAAFRKDTVEPTCRAMYAAWSSKQWNQVRHLLTDFLWEAQQMWIRAYAEKGYTNKLDDLEVYDMEIARVERDKHYDAVTVRVYVSCRDYTVDKTGKLVGGDKSDERLFSEYWTFVRATSATKKQAAEDHVGKCPNCGAPIDRMGATGVCGYCDAKVTTGDFDWVLSAITQDEVYLG